MKKRFKIENRMGKSSTKEQKKYPWKEWQDLWSNVPHRDVSGISDETSHM